MNNTSLVVYDSEGRAESDQWHFELINEINYSAAELENFFFGLSSEVANSRFVSSIYSCNVTRLREPISFLPFIVAATFEANSLDATRELARRLILNRIGGDSAASRIAHQVSISAGGEWADENAEEFEEAPTDFLSSRSNRFLGYSERIVLGKLAEPLGFSLASELISLRETGNDPLLVEIDGSVFIATVTREGGVLIGGVAEGIFFRNIFEIIRDFLFPKPQR